MATEDALALGVLLRRHRLARELTQEELAERAGVSPRAISEIERGGPHVPRRDTVALLAQALALTADERAAFVAAAHAPQALREAALPLRWDGATGVPVPLTPLIGRDQEERAILHLLQGGQVRLLTLTGPGGVGKTRLAQHVATTVATTYPDGVVFVRLAAVRDPRLVASTIAEALDVGEAGAAQVQAQLVAVLQKRQMLLVLDNFEQVEEAAPLVTTLLLACPALAVVVTSRHLLHLQGEHEFAVPTLRLPDRRHSVTADALAGCAAIALFMQRARAVAPEFALTDETAPAVAEICARLDGLPLALELAAARLRLLSPRALLERLSQRLTLLAGGARDLPAHQQTLRSTIAWSFDLLSPDEQALFRRLAVFAGGWTLEALESVCAGPERQADSSLLEGLASLVDKSLVGRGHSQEGTPRFTMLETIRDYAGERLAAAPAEERTMARRAHARYYLALAEEAAAAGGWVSAWGHLTSMPTGHPGWQARLTEDQANLREVLQWAQEDGDLEIGARLVGALGWFWYLEGHWTEARSWLDVFHAMEQASARSDPLPAPDAPLRRYLDAAGFASIQGDHQRADTLLTENLALLRRRGDSRGVAIVLAYRGSLDDVPRRAAALFDESLTLCRAVGDAEGTVFLLTSLADIALTQGDAARARALYAEAKAISRAQQDNRITVYVLERDGWSLAHYGDLRQARALLDEALALSLTAPHGSPFFQVQLRDRCAYVARAQGDYATALSILTGNLALLERVQSNEQARAWSLLSLGRTSRESGDRVAAAQYTTEGLRLATRNGDVTHRSLALETMALIAWEQGDLSQAAALGTEALALCRTAVAFDAVPQILVSLGLICRRQGDLGRACTYLIENLERPATGTSLEQTLGSLDGLAGVAVAQGRHADGVHLFGATDAARRRRGEALPPALRRIQEGDLSAARAVLGDDAFSAAWAVGQSLTLEQAIARALKEQEPT